MNILVYDKQYDKANLTLLRNQIGIDDKIFAVNKKEEFDNLLSNEKYKKFHFIIIDIRVLIEDLETTILTYAKILGSYNLYRFIFLSFNESTSHEFLKNNGVIFPVMNRSYFYLRFRNNMINVREYLYEKDNRLKFIFKTIGMDIENTISIILFDIIKNLIRINMTLENRDIRNIFEDIAFNKYFINVAEVTKYIERTFGEDIYSFTNKIIIAYKSHENKHINSITKNVLSINNLKYIRLMFKENAKGIAMITGIPQADIEQYENNKVRLSDETIDKIAKYFNLTSDFITKPLNEKEMEVLRKTKEYRDISAKINQIVNAIQSIKEEYRYILWDKIKDFKK